MIFLNCSNGFSIINSKGDSQCKQSFTTKSNALVYDWSDSNTVNFTNKAEDLRIFFNVDSDGKIVTSMDEDDDEIDTSYLMTFNKDAVTYSNSI